MTDEKLAQRQITERLDQIHQQLLHAQPCAVGDTVFLFDLIRASAAVPVPPSAAWRPDVNRYLAERPWTKAHPWLFETLIDFALMAKPIVLEVTPSDIDQVIADGDRAYMAIGNYQTATEADIDTARYFTLGRCLSMLKQLRAAAVARAAPPAEHEETKDP